MLFLAPQMMSRVESISIRGPAILPRAPTGLWAPRPAGVRVGSFLLFLPPASSASLRAPSEQVTRGRKQS